MRVDELRDEVLADAALAGDEDPGVALATRSASAQIAWSATLLPTISGLPE
jgi:hypothetical protein